MSEAGFRATLRSCVRALWTGVWSYQDFLEGASDACVNYLSKAWYEGAAECDVVKDELSDDEIDAMTKEIYVIMDYLPGFAEDIEENSKANGGLLTPLLNRVDTWAARYQSVKILAKSMACADRKFEWVIGPTETHCRSCDRLNGIVKRMSVWANAGILPQQAGADYLECGGYRCQCELEETDARATPGRLPRLP